MMNSLFYCIRFLTILPLKTNFKGEISLLVSWFTSVGLILGGILVIFDKVLYILIQNIYITSFISICLWIKLTRGLHLDGLADTADAFLSVKDTQGKLAIMKDPHIGTMGVIALIIIIIGKILFLCKIDINNRYFALLSTPVFGRFAMNILIQFFNCAKVQGLGSEFLKNKNFKSFLFAALIPLLFCIISFQSIILILATFIITFIFGLYCRYEIRGITGDTLGAVCEINEWCILFIFCL
ncbi:MAG: adenosylcobinamide-GDP ribazoletransferase [Candidatus Hydrogenedentota bacterium]